MDNENLIAGLEQSLRQIRQARNHKMRRLREIEGEVESLRQEIETLDNSAKQIETTMHTILFAARANREASNKRLSMDDLPDMNDMDDDYILPQRVSNKSSSNHSSRSVVQMHRSGKDDVPSINPDVQIKSHRFRDRTITQACTILMRESGRPLHVNEIYNRLLEGGFLFTGNNPTISIAVSLNRNRRFRKVAPGTFDLIIRDASQAAS